jgi:hypothetical protein
VAWFAIRHVIENERSFEERITLWEARSADEAILRAERDVEEYVSLLGGQKPLGLFQSYELAEPPGDDREVFSLIRRSDLSPEEYLDSFFSTGLSSSKSTSRGGWRSPAPAFGNVPEPERVVVPGLGVAIQAGRDDRTGGEGVEFSLAKPAEGGFRCMQSSYG